MVGRIGERREEPPGAPTHALAVGGHDPVVLLAVHLDPTERFPAAAASQLPPTGGPQVPHPVSLATPRDKVAGPLVDQGGRGVLIGRPLRRPTTVSVGPPSRIVIGFTTRRIRNPEGT